MRLYPLPILITLPIKWHSFFVFQCLFGKEAEKLEHANDDDRTYYIIERDPLVNKFISVPKDKGSLNCATFTAGIIEAVLTNCGFVRCHTQYIPIANAINKLVSLFFFLYPQPCKVTAHWHKGTTYMVKFEDFVITRDRQLEEK